MEIQKNKAQTIIYHSVQKRNNALLTHVYLNTIETCLILNHLLFGRQLLYSSNTKSIDKINRISNHFWDRWRHE